MLQTLQELIACFQCAVNHLGIHHWSGSLSALFPSIWWWSKKAMSVFICSLLSTQLCGRFSYPECCHSLSLSEQPAVSPQCTLKDWCRPLSCSPLQRAQRQRGVYSFSIRSFPPAWNLFCFFFSTTFPWGSINYFWFWLFWTFRMISANKIILKPQIWFPTETKN